MNKLELINAMAKECNLSKDDLYKAMNAFIKVAVATLKKEEKLTLVGFGSFHVIHKKARKGVNPITKGIIEITPRKAFKFHPCKELLSSALEQTES